MLKKRSLLSIFLLVGLSTIGSIGFSSWAIVVSNLSIMELTANISNNLSLVLPTGYESFVFCKDGFIVDDTITDYGFFTFNFTVDLTNARNLGYVSNENKITINTGIRDKSKGVEFINTSRLNKTLNVTTPINSTDQTSLMTITDNTRSATLDGITLDVSPSTPSFSIALKYKFNIVAGTDVPATIYSTILSIPNSFSCDLFLVKVV